MSRVCGNRARSKPRETRVAHPGLIILWCTDRAWSAYQPWKESHAD